MFITWQEISYRALKQFLIGTHGSDFHCACCALKCNLTARWGNLDFWTFYFLPVGRPSTQWLEGPACLLCDNNGNQLVLHYVHWYSGWVSLFHFALHACPQPQLKISCSLRQPDAHTYSSLNQTVYHFHRSRVYFNMFFWSSLALWFYVGHSWHEVLEWSTTGRWK